MASDDRGRLFICATPIGNLQDITLRCLQVLKEAELIAAEDTRHTRKLLNHYDIGTPLTSLHEHNERRKSELILQKLLDGKNVAVVSDAGMPGISDPGGLLIAKALAHGIQVEAVPGPSAVITALSLSGLPMERFIFDGFLPRTRKERVKYFEQISGEERTIVFYEAPHRLVDALRDLAEIIPDRPIAVCRELTKQHEEVFRGTVGEALEHFQSQGVKGEITVVLGGVAKSKATEGSVDCAMVKDRLQELLQSGHSTKDAIRIIVDETGIRRNIVYRLATELEKNKPQQ
ncbi:MAG: 16S rRNA (cytidine(1402)-2'-O)-methyltransferase [Firmicutes bacterium]|nr:16S rRNA (cytidine(1402)-2'-O)-methyltransferase [Bacillota bacterium]